MAYKQNPGRGQSQKTGGGIPTPLLQTVPTDEKTGKQKVITEKNPNLSSSETNLISDESVSESGWRELNRMGRSSNTDMKTWDNKRIALAKTQRTKDSTFMVNNRVKLEGKYVNSNMAFKKPVDQEYEKSFLGKKYPSSTTKYSTNTFSRNPKSGNVVTD